MIVISWRFVVLVVKCCRFVTHKAREDIHVAFIHTAKALTKNAIRFCTLEVSTVFHKLVMQEEDKDFTVSPEALKLVSYF